MRVDLNPRHTAVLLSACMLAIFVSEAACSNSPGSSNIQKALERLDGRYKVESVAVEATENDGTSVEPLIEQRFRAKLVGKGVFYISAPDFAYWNKHFQITLVEDAPGFPTNRPPETEVYGIATSTLNADNWQTRISISTSNGDPLSQDRHIGPAAGFGGKVYIRGSDAFNRDIAPRDAAFKAHVAQTDAAFLTVGYGLKGTIDPADRDTAIAMGDAAVYPVAITVHTADATTGEFTGLIFIDKQNPVPLTGHLDKFQQELDFSFSEKAGAGEKPCSGSIQAQEGDYFFGQFSCARQYIGSNSFNLRLSHSAP